MSTSVIAFYDTPDKANEAIDQIVKAGFARDTVDLLSGKEAVQPGLAERIAEHGVGRDDSKILVDAIGRGCALVIVDAEDHKANDARIRMEQAGAADIDRIVADIREGGERKGDGAGRRADGDGEIAGEVVPVVEEDVSVGKRQVLRGGVRVTSEVKEQPLEETVTLREEHVDVERRDADRELSPEDAETVFEDKTVEVTEIGEEARAEKKARVVGEVRVGKSVEEHEETVQATARRTEVDVSDVQPQERKARESEERRVAEKGS